MCNARRPGNVVIRFRGRSGIGVGVAHEFSALSVCGTAHWVTTAPRLCCVRDSPFDVCVQQLAMFEALVGADVHARRNLTRKSPWLHR